MKFIQSVANPSGNYPAIQALDFAPDGWFPIASNCDTSAMQTHAGFVTLTITDGVVTAIMGDDTAYQAWKAANPERPTEPDALTQTHIALAELAETESAHDLENKLALAELAETIG